MFKQLHRELLRKLTDILLLGVALVFPCAHELADHFYEELFVPLVSKLVHVVQFAQIEDHVEKLSCSHRQWFVQPTYSHHMSR